MKIFSKMVSCKVQRGCYSISTSQMVELKFWGIKWLILQCHMADWKVTVLLAPCPEYLLWSLYTSLSSLLCHLVLKITWHSGRNRFAPSLVHRWKYWALEGFFSSRLQNEKSFASKSKFIFVTVCWLFNVNKSYMGYLKIIQSLGFEKKIPFIYFLISHNILKYVFH